ncbi:unnamed protein product [Meganyctiphanes norvegica]|uniref:Uncharacterized protein n=1 Tax=Meganyctiphanes norvegica TaxID=48144 RepID=A0AAV2Q4K7_MEGNR
MLSGLLVVNCGITCYHCTDDLDTSPSYPYREDCGLYDYDGTKFYMEYGNMCEIMIYDNGHTVRFPCKAHHDDGYCYDYVTHVNCFCTGDLCNTHSFCAQCGYPRPTPAENVITTLTTAKPSTFSPDTTTMTIAEPSPHSGNLRCYTCFNCPTIDESTPTIEDASFVTCVSTFLLSSDMEVIRSESDEDHPGGSCIQHSQTLMCWCSKDLCNDGSLPQNYKLIHLE